MLCSNVWGPEKLGFNASATALAWPLFLSLFLLLSIFCVLCFFPFAQLFRQYLHQSFLLSRAGDFGSASVAGRDCSASGLDDAPSGLTNEFRVRAFPAGPAPSPRRNVYQPTRLEKISAHRIGLLRRLGGWGGLRGLSFWRQNRKTLRKRVNNDFSFVLQQRPLSPGPNPYPTLHPRLYPPFAFGRRAVKTSEAQK